MTEQKDWEEEFDSKFNSCNKDGGFWSDSGTLRISKDKLKSFIRSLVKPKIDKTLLVGLILNTSDPYKLADAIIKYIESQNMTMSKKQVHKRGE